MTQEASHNIQVAPGLNERPLYDDLPLPDTSCYMAPGLFTAAEAVAVAMQVGLRLGWLKVLTSHHAVLLPWLSEGPSQVTLSQGCKRCEAHALCWPATYASSPSSSHA